MYIELIAMLFYNENMFYFSQIYKLIISTMRQEKINNDLAKAHYLYTYYANMAICRRFQAPPLAKLSKIT